ncbi:hypothetical protein Mapa_009425 [Marchantia paleacea]|nr:hypothetical protein Mapa_009425 [Marchantia paleacea]
MIEAADEDVGHLRTLCPIFASALLGAVQQASRPFQTVAGYIYSPLSRNSRDGPVEDACSHAHAALRKLICPSRSGTT